MSNSKYQEAKDNIVNTLARQIDYKTYKNLYSKDFDTLQELVDKTTWIPVEKKLPPMFVKVLITYEDKYLNPHINVAFVDHHYEWIYPFRSKHTYRIIAWMPLPKPYLGSDKDE
ncbi:DUF551 domain-containing protein [Thomasclavelia ramosa]|uniref:hypothetical protein n=1 Tax=Thomasclavelia ramosa TaxID=1547 RepID=UPI00344B3DB7